MQLIACGTVVDGTPTGSIIQVEQERCNSCPGGCFRFKSTRQLTSDQPYPVGSKVQILTSVASISIASLLIFGLVPLTLLIAFLLAGPLTPLEIGCLALLSLVLSAIIGRTMLFRILKYEIEAVDSTS